jgi:hypothetical protein
MIFTVPYSRLFSLWRNMIMESTPVTRKSSQLITQAQDTM